MTDIILAVVIGAIVAAAAWYVIRAKRRGVKCIGCPAGGSCCSHQKEEPSSCSCGSGQGHSCCCHTEEQR